MPVITSADPIGELLDRWKGERASPRRAALDPELRRACERQLDLHIRELEIAIEEQRRVRA